MLSKKSQLMFFEQLFGTAWANVNLSPLVKFGAIIEVNFSEITMELAGKKLKIVLPVGTTSLMKKTCAPAMIESAVNAIKAFIDKAYDELTGSLTQENMDLFAGYILKEETACGLSNIFLHSSNHDDKIAKIKDFDMASLPIPPFPDGGLPGAVMSSSLGVSGPKNKLLIGNTGFSGVINPDIYLSEAVKGFYTIDPVFENAGAPAGDYPPPGLGQAYVPSKYAPPAKHAEKPAKKKSKDSIPAPTTNVVKLRDATEVGQKVYGTSPGSVYRVVALNSRVKLAARIVGSSISIRGEFNKPHQDEVAELEKIGMKMASSEHMSMHVDAGDIPVGRVVGAFLYGVDIDFDDQVKNVKGIE